MPRARVFVAVSGLIGIMMPHSTILAATEKFESTKSIIPDVYVRDVDMHSVDSDGIAGSFRLHNMEDAVVGGIDYIVMVISPFPEIAPDEIIGDDPIVYSREYVSANISMGPKSSGMFTFTHDIPPLPNRENDYRVRIQLVTANGREMGWDDQDVVIQGNLDAFAVAEPLMVIAESTDPLVEQMAETRLDPEEDDAIQDQVVVTNEDTERSELLYNIEEMMDIEDPLHRSEWNPLEGVNVDPGAEAVLQSRISNVTENQLEGDIELSFRRDLTSTTEFESIKLDPIALDSGEEKYTNTPFIMPTEPGAYKIFLTVVGEHGQRISTFAEFRVVVRGPSASITGVTVQEVSFSAGQPVVLDINFIGPADRETVTMGSIEVAVLDDGVSVGTSRSDIDLDSGIQTANTRIILDRTISGTPAAQVVIRDSENNILDTYEIEFDREVMLAALSERPIIVTEESANGITLSIVIGALALVAIFSAAIFIRRGFTPPSTLCMFILILFTGMGLGARISIEDASAYHSHYMPMINIWRSQGKVVSITEAKDWGRGPWEAVGTSMKVTRIHRYGSRDHEFLRHTMSLKINKPIPGIDNHMMAIGNQVDYESKVDYSSCANRILHYNAWAHIAEGGGHYSTHREGSWDEVVALYPFGSGITNHMRKSRSSGPMKGKITIKDNHISEDGKLTLWSDVWVRLWHEDDGASLEKTRYYHLMIPFLFTQFSGLTPAPPAAPVVTLDANRDEITGDQPSKVSWEVENADRCDAFSFRRKHNNNENWDEGTDGEPWVPDWQTANVSAPAPGNKSVQFPLEDVSMEYLLTLSCDGPGGSDSDSVIVTANPDYPAYDIRDASCSVDPTTANIGDTVDYTAKALGGTGTYSYEWEGVSCGEGSFYYCDVDDIYAEQVPGFIYYNMYIKVNNLPLGINEYHMRGAGTYDSRTFTVISREPNGSALLKDKSTYGKPDYVLARKSEIGLADLSKNAVCASKNESPPEGAVCREDFKEKDVRVVIESGEKSVSVDCPSGSSKVPEKIVLDFYRVDVNDGSRLFSPPAVNVGDRAKLAWQTNLSSDDQCYPSMGGNSEDNTWTEASIDPVRGAQETRLFTSDDAGKTIRYILRCVRNSDGSEIIKGQDVTVNQDSGDGTLPTPTPGDFNETP